jgi:SPP1 family predicted phage head-tail adaptor
MRAGNMRSRIRIEYKSSTVDPDYGTKTETWLPLAEVWAEAEDILQGKSETTTNGLRIASDRVRIKIRYREGISPDMRIIELNGMRRTLSITAGPSMTKWREELEIMTESYSS